jgi:hypothetical protein
VIRRGRIRCRRDPSEFMQGLLGTAGWAVTVAGTP